MSGITSHRARRNGFDIEMRQGWPEYRQALVCLHEAGWDQALELFAEAETAFRTDNDHNGLWRTLIGQAIVHWNQGMATLAVARALAAARIAAAENDQLAIGYVAWHLANMSIGQGDYRKAAKYFNQTQQALDNLHIAPPGGVLAVAAQLCQEVLRWQQLDDQQSERHTTETVIAELQRDLISRLPHAAEALRAAWVRLFEPDQQLDCLYFLPEEAAMTSVPASQTQRPSLAKRLSSWWRQLVEGNNMTADVPIQPPIALLADRAASANTGRQTPDPGIIIETVDADEQANEQEEQDEQEEDELADELAAHTPVEPDATETPAIVYHQGLVVYCFGRFRVYCNDAPVERWQSSRARTLFKYLITRRVAVSKEVLAEMFWPDSEPELARRSLHQAIYCLRQTFRTIAPDMKIVDFADGCYQIDPRLSIWVENEIFKQTIERARTLYADDEVAAAVREYAIAADLYSGDFLEEDRYGDWAEETRRVCRTMYLEALHRLARYYYENDDHPGAIMFCRRALACDSCDEEAHLMLMQCYMAQNLRHLAVRQYQICIRSLEHELGLLPSDKLETFYRQAVAAS